MRAVVQDCDGAAHEPLVAEELGHRVGLRTGDLDWFVACGRCSQDGWVWAQLAHHGQVGVGET